MPMNFIKKHLPFICWFMAGFITCGLGLYFRLYPLYHNVASDSYEQATMMVLGRLRLSITEQVNTQYPTMPNEPKQKLIQTRMNEVLRKDNQKIRKAFDDVGLNLLKSSGDKKFYLQESDSYYFLDLTKNILNKGDVSTKIEGNKYFNERMTAPLGQWEPQLWHPYIGAITYHIVKLFNPDTDIMFGVAFTPILLFPLVVLGFFFACRALGCSVLPTFTASVFFVLAHIFLKRSTFAWYDNDIYTIIFPVIALGCLFLALKQINNIKKTVLWGGLAAITATIYGRFWPGWGFLWGLMLIGTGLVFIQSIVFKRASTKNLFFLGISIFFVAVVALLFMYTPQQIAEIFSLAFGELQKFTQPKINGWPDLFIVVGELKQSSLDDIIMMNGGVIICFGALLTLLYCLINAVRKRQELPQPISILLGYLIVTLYLALGAQRFTMLTLPAVALLFAYGLELLWSNRLAITSRLKTPFSNPSLTSATLGIVFLSATLLPIATSQRTIRSLITPIFNSAWERALTKINDKTPSDAVINTWWSPGHFVKAIAERRVTFDGASIRGDIAYWLNKVYLSKSETEALSVLRMLNTSSNEATRALEQKGWPLSKAVALINGILPMPRDEAEKILRKILPPQEAVKILFLTHGKPGQLPPSYLLLYNELMDGNVLLAYLGKWDFAKVERLNENPSTLKQIPRKSDPRFIDLIWSLVGGPYRQTSLLNPAHQKTNMIFFDQGVTLDTNDMSVAIKSRQYGEGVPASIVYLDATTNKVVEKKQPDATLSYSVVYVIDSAGPHILLMDRDLAISLIVKLYYFDGKGLEHFKPFAKESDLTGRTKIFVYEIKWPNGF